MQKALSRPSPEHLLSGGRVLALLLGFFGSIFAVNGVFIYAALSTYTGEVAQEPYRKGLGYNLRIAADERQARLNWSATIALALPGRAQLRLVDQAGAAVTGYNVSLRVGRPSTEAFDRTIQLEEVAPGAYAGTMAPLAPGAWIANAEIRSGDGGDPLYRARRRLWLTQ